MVYIPLIGALAMGAGTVLERVILKHKKIEIKLYQVLSFLSVCLVMAPFLYFLWRVEEEAFQLKNLVILLGVIVCAMLANYIAYYSLKWEKVTNLEPARLFENFFVVVLAIIFNLFTEGLYETNLKVIIPTLIASVALIFPHINKDKLKMNKYVFAALVGSFLFALELILSRLILDFYSPLTFYFVRCSAVFMISLVVLRPKVKGMDRHIAIMTLIAGAIWVVYRFAVYFGYLNYGVVLTTLILMLAPVFIYAFANIFLKEKLNWKNIVSAVIIIGCVLYITLL